MQRVALEDVSERLEVYLDKLKTSGPLLITQDGRPVAVLMPLDEAGLAALRRREAAGPMADEERVEEDTWASGSEAAEDQDDEAEAAAGSTDEESMQTSARPHPPQQPTGVAEETE